MANPFNVIDVTGVDMEYRHLIWHLRNNQVKRAYYEFDFDNHDHNEAYPQFQELIGALEVNKGFGREHCQLKQLSLNGLFKSKFLDKCDLLPNDMNNRRRNFFRALLPCLRHHPTLERLDLSYNGIDDDIIRDSFYSASEEQWFPALENLDLNHNNIAGRWLETLLCKDTLKELNLSYNRLRGDGATAVISFLVSTRCKLQSIYLSHRSINREGYVAICNSLMSTGRPLSRLVLVGVLKPIGDKIVQLFVALLREKKCSLRDLDLASCRISPKSMISMANALSTNTWLESVSLRCSYFQSLAEIGQFSKAFEEVLRKNATLQNILLAGGNNASKFGASIVDRWASALEKSNYMLQEISIRGFEIGDEFERLEQLDPILEQNKKIKKFHDHLIKNYHELKEKHENRSCILPHCIERCNSKPGLIFSILKMCNIEIFRADTTE